MDPAIITYLVQALGGLIGGNILGALTGGGRGVAGRTIIGLIGGLAAGYAATNVEAVSNIAAYWANLRPGDVGVYLENAITGLIGGAILGLIGGLVLRPRG
jgi:hypothetical protein